MDDIPKNAWYRALQILPGAMSWLILLGPVVAALWYPKATYIFVTVYILLWFLGSLKWSVSLIYAYRTSKKYIGLDWDKLLGFFSDTRPDPKNSMDAPFGRSNPVGRPRLGTASGLSLTSPRLGLLEEKTMERVRELRQKGLFKNWHEIHHLVIMPTYKEDKEVLESSIEALAKTSFPLKRVIFVLATEERDSVRAEGNAKYLKQKFAGTFGQFHVFMHPKNLPGEIAAKGANISYACKQIAEILAGQGVDFGNVLVTTLDADNRPHPLYFASLTYHYLMEKKRDKRIYQPLAFFYNNIWDVPFTNRLISLANTFWYLAESGDPRYMFNASVYSQSLQALSSMDFWSKQTIVEDLHQFWRAYFHFRGDLKVIPLFIPVYQDALQNRTYFTSLVGQYKQLRRWAWGASEIPYVIIKMWRLRHSLPPYRNITLLARSFYLQIIWTTAPIILLLNKSIPTILNPKFSHSIFAFNMGQILDIIFTLMLITIVISLWMSLISMPKRKGRQKIWQTAGNLLQWLALPFVTVIYGAIPAIEAQTRLMLNKSLGFEVTEKIRKIN